MPPPFTSTQEMYNYAANQLIVQKLSQQTVKKNLMDHGVTDADADIVIQNMMVEIEKDKPSTAAKAAAASINVKSSEPPFASTQEMYNFAANQMIVQKLSNQTVKNNLVNHGVIDAEADTVIQNMMVEIAKNKPVEVKTVEVNAKRAEGKRMMLVGLIVGAVGAAISGTSFNIAGESTTITYGIMAVGAVLFLRGLMRMF